MTPTPRVRIYRFKLAGRRHVRAPASWRTASAQARPPPTPADAYLGPMKLPAPPLRLDWRFALGQVILIALGVLLGLAGTAWWSERQDREREHLALGNALDVARLNERRLRQAIVEDSTSHFVNRLIIRDLPCIPDDSIVTLMSLGSWYSDGRPLISPFTALLQTGDLAHVRSAPLRAMLASYLGEMEARVHAVNELNGDWIQLGGTNAAATFRIPRLAPAALGAAERNDPALWKLVALRASLGSNMVANERIMLRFTTDLRKALEAELHVASVPLPVPRILRDSY